ncbi:MAG TPA: S53 family peptidase [Anaeromyxobacter sp.]|nr:S53 family peptidase [Anaeromyxobacter sp.]
MARYSLRGSERTAAPGAVASGRADPGERLEVTVILRRRGASALAARVRQLASGDRSREPMSREEFARQHGAAPADLARVKRFARAHGLVVVEEDAPRRTVILSGTVSTMEEAFGVKLEVYEHGQGSYRGRVGPVRLPAELKGVVEAVLGLDNRPQALPHFRWRARGEAASAASSFSPTELASLYRFPAGDGRGECIAIVELGGGYRPADLAAYFAKLQIAAPGVTAVSVDHGKNQPTGDPNGPDAEVMLDIEVAGALAPGARLAVYFAPNTDAGFLDAVTRAIHDARRRPSVVSISWGGPESAWTSQAMTAFDAALQAAAALGVTVCVASGDSGSADGVSDGADHVNFPASSPHALGCGGTRLTASGGRIASEVVWNEGAQAGATGGGVSAVFPLPPWQQGLGATRTGGRRKALAQRGVPDVSGDADPRTGYEVRVDGADGVVGGTSAVAPLWAGLLARLNASLGRPLGYLNPSAYRNGAAFRDVTSGNNGDFAASAGWDACTGLGSPDGTALAAALASSSPPSSAPGRSKRNEGSSRRGPAGFRPSRSSRASPGRARSARAGRRPSPPRRGPPPPPRRG